MLSMLDGKQISYKNLNLTCYIDFFALELTWGVVSLRAMKKKE